MLSDTIIVVLVCIIPAQHHDHNRYEEAFREADRRFDIEMSGSFKGFDTASDSTSSIHKGVQDKTICDFAKLFKTMYHEKDERLQR